jgi:hypothetical protein
MSFEGPNSNEPIKIDFQNGSDAEIEHGSPAPHEGMDIDPYDFEAAKHETEFEVLGRVMFIDQQIASLREQATHLPVELFTGAQKEMAALVQARERMEALRRSKAKGEELADAA